MAAFFQPRILGPSGFFLAFGDWWWPPHVLNRLLAIDRHRPGFRSGNRAGSRTYPASGAELIQAVEVGSSRV